MTNDPVDLDERRGMAAQKATEISRKRPHEFQTDQATLQLRQAETSGQVIQGGDMNGADF